MKNILLQHHLGLGDHIVCNGLVHYILESIKPKTIFLPTKNNNISTIIKMYSHEPRIKPVGVDGDHQVESLSCFNTCDQIIRVGFSKVRDDWDVSFYETNQIPFSYRWSMFKIYRDIERENNLKNKLKINEKFLLIHNKSSAHEYNLKKIKTDIRHVHVSPETDNIFDWCGLAEEAEEVHCIDSSFVHLAQSLNVKKGIFHNIRTMRTQFRLKNSWDIVDYKI